MAVVGGKKNDKPDKGSRDPKDQAAAPPEPGGPVYREGEVDQGRTAIGKDGTTLSFEPTAQDAMDVEQRDR